MSDDNTGITHIHSPDGNFRKSDPSSPKGDIINVHPEDSVLPFFQEHSDNQACSFIAISEGSSQLFLKAKWTSMAIDQADDSGCFVFLKHEGAM